jgi:O-antigen/teichoic acid export membrane protein
VLTLVTNWLFSLWITKKYASVFRVRSKLPKEEQQEIYKSTRGLLCHKIGFVVVSSTDNIIISKFISLAAVGLYSNYGTLVSAVTRLGVSLVNGMLPSIANYTASASKDDCYTMMKRILLINLWLACWTTVCLFALLNPFITVWLGENYLLSYSVVAVVCLQHYLQTSRLTANNFVYSAGLFMRDKIRPLIESAINLIVSVVLAKLWGIVGVFVGTCVSGLLTYYWREPYLLFKNYMQRSSAGYWGIQVKWFALTVALSGGMYFLFSLLPGGLGGLILRFALAAVVPNVVILLFCIGSDEFRYAIDFVKRKFLRKGEK